MGAWIIKLGVELENSPTTDSTRSEGAMEQLPKEVEFGGKNASEIVCK
jgi:hypothetical protein